MWDILLLVVVLIAITYWYNKKHFAKWKNAGIPGPVPSYIFGNLTEAAFLKSSVGGVYNEIYRSCANTRYAGIFILRRPAILLRDPEIIKDVVIKDFSSFHDNDMEVTEQMDLIFANNPFTMKGEKWKTRRGQHIRNFTPGKVKSMYALMEDVGMKMVDYLNAQIAYGGGKHTMMSEELALMYTTDNVAVCSLGINGRSFEGPKADILKTNKFLTDSSLWNYINLIFLFVIPKLGSFVSARLIPSQVKKKYCQLIEETLNYRKSTNITRNDFFDNVRELKGRPATIDEILAQVGGFFIDGVLTSTIAISFMLYELAANAHVQNKLREEIASVLNKREGQLDLDALNEMPYLDAVIAESLRKFPPLSHLTKVCTKPYTLPPADDSCKPLTVEVGTPIVIPLMALQHDENHFSEPNRFDPDRFVGPNRENITKCCYMPFGEGPRICLGMRFALVQAKVAIAKIVSAFELKLNERTKTPLELNSRSIFVSSRDGLWIDFFKRRI